MRKNVTASVHSGEPPFPDSVTYIRLYGSVAFQISYTDRTLRLILEKTFPYVGHSVSPKALCGSVFILPFQHNAITYWKAYSLGWRNTPERSILEIFS